MSNDNGMQIRGLKEAIENCESKHVLRQPLRDFFDLAGKHVANEAKKRAPVDRGRLRASITDEMDSSSIPMYTKVGSNVDYAPFQEYGTGLLTDGEGGKGGRHWPPSAALDVWARRHGFASGYVVARGIGMRGGLAPKRFLRGALEDSARVLEGYFRQLEEAMTRRGNGEK